MKTYRSLFAFVALLFAALCLAGHAFAQTVPALVVAAPAAAPFYASGEFWTGLFGLVAGIVAIWRNQAASTSRKVNETLVLAIEEATKLPGVVEAEQRIKQLIRDRATDYGVQPILHRIVKDLTDPATAEPVPPAAS